MGGNRCEYTHVWELRPQLQNTTPPGGGGGGAQTEDVSLDVVAGTMKGESLYQSRVKMNRDPRIICHTGHTGDAPMYFELDEHGNPHVCAI